MSNSFRKAMLRGVGFAAASAFVAAPSFAAPQSGAEQLRLDGEQAQAASQPQDIAQTYIPLVGEIGDGGFEQATGWYVTVGAGASTPSNTSYRTSDLEQNFGIPDFDGDFEFGGGFAVDAGVGYDFGAIRTELTYSYNRASLNGLSVSGNGFSGDTNSISGDVNKNDVFGSVYLDIPFGRWVPYIGGGVGYSNFSTPSWTLGDYRFDGGSRGLFGWQGKVGLTYAIDYNWDVYAEGVYQGASGFYEGDLHVGTFNNWGGKLGFRYRFAQPPVVVVEEPAPAPAPEPAPAPMPEPEPAPPVRGLW